MAHFSRCPDLSAPPRRTATGSQGWRGPAVAAAISRGLSRSGRCRSRPPRGSGRSFTHRRLQRRTLNTVFRRFGEIDVDRIACCCEGKRSIHPLDESLQLRERSFSYELQKQLIKAAIQGPFREATHFHNNTRYMRYHEYLSAGFPIASGPVEGASKNLINDRMEAPACIGLLPWPKPSSNSALCTSVGTSTITGLSTSPRTNFAYIPKAAGPWS